MQRAKDLNPESIFIFVPGGAQPAALGKAFAERGIDPSKIKIIGTGDVVDESSAKNMGDAALGIYSVWHYDYNDDTKLNKEFVAAYNAEFKRNPDFGSVGGYDGMRVIYEALTKAGGKTDGDSLVAAAKGISFESPRGPFQIDPETRDIVQNISVRQVRKVGGGLRNVVVLSARTCPAAFQYCAVYGVAFAGCTVRRSRWRDGLQRNGTRCGQCGLLPAYRSPN